MKGNISQLVTVEDQGQVRLQEAGHRSVSMLSFSMVYYRERLDGNQVQAALRPFQVGAVRIN
jgi:hypothetical protein